MSFITMAQAISSVVGGVPVQPASGMTVIEKLRAAKSMIPGDMGGLLGKMLTGGPAAILQNPIGSLQGALQGKIGALAGAISGGTPGFGGVISALTGAGGLQAAVGNLGQVSNALSGLTGAAEGGFGLLDAIGHANITSLFGSALPASLSVDKAMGPVMMGDRLAAMSAQFTVLADGLVAGTIAEDHAISQIGTMTDEINAVLGASTHALSTIQNQAVSIAQTASLISLVASGPPAMTPIANMLIKDSVKSEIQDLMDEQVRV